MPAVRRLVGKFDPAERDARNRDLGKAGERFVVEFERDRLRRAGRDDLADDVQWVSDVDGDGYRVLNLWPIARRCKQFVTSAAKRQPRQETSGTFKMVLA